MEDRPCVLPLCPPSKSQILLSFGLVQKPSPFSLACPDYTVSSFHKDSENALRARITFGIELGRVAFGKLVRQEITFKPLDEDSYGTIQLKQQ